MSANKVSIQKTAAEGRYMMFLNDSGVLMFYGKVAGFLIGNVLYINDKFRCGETSMFCADRNLPHKVVWLSEQSVTLDKQAADNLQLLIGEYAEKMIIHDRFMQKDDSYSKERELVAYKAASKYGTEIDKILTNK